MGQTTSKIAPRPHLIRGSLAHSTQPTISISAAQPYAQQTDKQTNRETDHATCVICSNRSHLCTAVAMRCVLKLIVKIPAEVMRCRL